MNLSRILKKPIITEKALSQSALGKYIFEVDRQASKTEIKRAVKNAFNVDVVAVKTINVKGKIRRFGRRRVRVALGDWKKAIVQLAPGQKIDIFSVPEEAKEKPSKKEAKKK